MKDIKLTILPGDGIGPEVMDAALSVLDVVGKYFNLRIQTDTELVGGASLDAFGEPVTDFVLDKCKDSDAVLLGAVGGAKWDSLPQEKKPERGLLKLRESLGLFSNLRPAVIFDSLANASSLKKEIILGSDVMVVRELTGGIYFGEPRGYDKQEGYNTLRYRKEEVLRIADVAFQLAEKRDGHVTSVDKANVLDSSQFWREIVHDVHKKYNHISLTDMYVDNAAMQLVKDPKQFDVILTQNMFGDILSDITAMITGSLGMLPSASVGNNNALYEPVHGTAPEIAGQNKANPIAMISSVAMMLDITMDMPEISEQISSAIETVLKSGVRTVDILDDPLKTPVSTTQMCDCIIDSFKESMISS